MEDSQPQSSTTAQGSNDRWIGPAAADGGINATGGNNVQHVAAIESQQSREYSMSRPRKGRRQRGVIYCPADWAKRSVTQPRRCKACQRVVTKGSFGEICRTCGDFVCSVPCRKNVVKNGGCECMSVPAPQDTQESQVRQPQPVQPPPLDQHHNCVQCPQQPSPNAGASDRAEGLEKSRTQARASELVQDDLSIFERAACICCEIVRTPVPALWQRVPPQLERRVLELMRDAIAAHADAECYAARTGTA